jgi:hypothetical protein
MAWNPKDSNLYQNDGFMFQDPANTGIGNFFNNMAQWKAMNGEGEGRRIGQGGAASIQDLNKNGVGAALGNAWMDNGNPHGQYNQQLYDAMKGYTYKGEDGKQYMINGNYYHGGGYDQEGANTAGDLMYGGVGALGHADKGRDIGEMSYSVTGFKPDWGGDMGAFNGQMFDMYDRTGKYVGGNLPMSMGDDQFNKHALTTALMVASAGLGGAALAGAQAGGGIGAGLAGASNPVIAAEAAGLGAGGLGSMGSAGLGGAGAVGGGLGTGNGAFLGEGIQSGIPAWDGAAGGAAGGFGTVPLSGVGAPTAPGIGAPGGAAGGSSGLKGMLGQELFSIPGLGGVTGSNLLQIATPLLGALSGSQGQEVTQTQTKELPEWLQGPVYGPGGVIPQSQWLMGQQMNNPGLLASQQQMKDKEKKKKERARKGLL